MKTFKARTILAGAMAIAIGATAALAGTSAAVAADGYWTPQGTAQPWFVLDGNTGAPVVLNGAERLDFEAGVIASPVADNFDATFQGPTDAEGVTYFISKIGDEKAPDKWLSTGFAGFKPGTKEVLQPTSNISQLDPAGMAPVLAAGGDFSIGIAFTKFNGVALASTGPSFTHVNVQKTTGDWTFVTPEFVADQPGAAGSPGNIDLEATVAAPVDGAFSLSIPTGAKATLGAPAWVNNQSTSTGVLPTFSITDERRVTQKGWDATASVANFTRSGGTETIGADSLRLAPKTVAGSTSTGVTAVAPFQAAAAAQPFASAPAGAGLGVTNLSADLTFAAPAGSVQGTYTSKVTVTVVSK